jgi:large subunit ribosomal protein L24
MKMGIRKGDQVIVLSGRDSYAAMGQTMENAKQYKVLRTIPSEGKIVAEGLMMATKHKKPRKQGEAGGIMKQETPIQASKVMRVCPKCDKPTRLGYVVLEDGTKHRQCKKCKETI